MLKRGFFVGQKKFFAHSRTACLATLIPVVILLAVLFMRWILVVGYGDFGMEYDFTSRLKTGQLQGRDFFSIYPPFSGYSLLLFMLMFGDHYLIVNIHLWFWWLVNITVATGVILVYGGSARKTAFVATAVALLIIPPNTGGKAVESIASALSGLSVIFFLQHFRKKTRYLAALAGVVGGICVFVKANVGIAILISLLAMCLIMGAFQRRMRNNFLAASFLILFGATIGILVVIIMLGFHGGYQEVAKQIFRGGIEIKGGFFALILRTIPRITTTLNNPQRFIVEFGFTFPIIICLGICFYRIFISKAPDLSESLTNNSRLPYKLLWLICAVIAILSIWSIFPYNFPHKLTSLFYNLNIVSLPFFLWQVLYIIVAAALIASIIAGITRREFLKQAIDNDLSPIWISLMTLIWTFGVVASARHNIIYAATLFMPSIAVRFRGNQEKKFYSWLTVFLIIWTFAWHLAPNWRSTFAQLTQLPTNSKFSGLYWPDDAASVPGSYPVWSSSKVIREMHNNITPCVQGKSVLWLEPGPGAAFGGNIYSYGIHGLSSNNVPPWAEKKFGDRIQANPPDFIVSSTFDGWEDPKWSFMRPKVIQPWLQAHYRLVWTLPGDSASLFLWEKQKSQ